MIFDAKETNSGRSISERISGGWFPIGITKSEKLLTIVEKRAYGNILLLLLGAIVFAFAGYPILQSLLGIGELMYLILFALACLAGIGYIINKIIQTPYKRISIFDKDQNLYKIVGIKLFSNEDNIGNLDQIKKVNIQATKHTDSEGDDTYSYFPYLQLDDFLSYPDYNIVPLQEGGGLADADRIASEIASFLKLPAPEVTGDVPEKKRFMEGLSILQ